MQPSVVMIQNVREALVKYIVLSILKHNTIRLGLYSYLEKKAAKDPGEG